MKRFSIYINLIITFLSYVSFSPSVSADLVINEIMYAPEETVPRNVEFVELYNSGGESIQLVGYTFDDSGSVEKGKTVILSGMLDPGQYAVLSRAGHNPNERWGVTPIAEFNFGLGKKETLTLRNADGEVVDVVTYNSSAPWDSRADETGSSLELIDAAADNSQSISWAASLGPATPGRKNSVTSTPEFGLIGSISVVPLTPADGQEIVIAVTVPRGRAPSLKYLINFGSEKEVFLHDDGVAPDLNKADQIFTGTIPGQQKGDLVRFRFEDLASLWTAPSDGRNYFGVLVGDDGPDPPTGLPVFEWFVNNDDHDSLYHKDHIFDRLYSISGSVLVVDGVVFDNMKVKIRGGGYARKNRKKQGLSFDFASDFNAYLPQLVPYKIDEFALSREWDSSIDRSFASWELFESAGFPAVPDQYIRMERNGEFYGLYRFSVKYDKAWRNANGINGEFFKAKGKAFQGPLDFEKKHPDNADYSALIELSEELKRPTDSRKIKYLYDHVDIANVVNFLAVANLIGHFDSSNQNFYLHKDTADTGLWQIYPWDLSNTFGVRAGYNGCGDPLYLEVNCNQNPMWDAFDEVDSPYEKIKRRVLRFFNASMPRDERDNFDEMIWRRMRTLIDGPMADGVLEGKFGRYYNLISQAEFYLDERRWGEVSYRTPSDFNKSIDERRNAFLIDGRLPQSQKSVPQVVITELMYSRENSIEFVELHNPGLVSVDLSGWEIKGVDFTFPGGSVLLGKQYLVVTESIRAFQARYPDVPNVVLLQFDGGLKSRGELLELRTDTNKLVDSIEYRAVSPWPLKPAVDRFSLSLLDIGSDNSLALSWRSSIAVGGTPGRENFTIASD